MFCTEISLSLIESVVHQLDLEAVDKTHGEKETHKCSETNRDIIRHTRARTHAGRESPSKPPGARYVEKQPKAGGWRGGHVTSQNEDTKTHKRSLSHKHTEMLCTLHNTFWRGS